MKKEVQPHSGDGGDITLATVTRSDRVESQHRGRMAVVAADGSVLAALGDVDEPIYARSAVKPFQALPFVERGLAEQLGCTDAELAIMSASHDGTARHVEIVRGLLARGGLEAESLRCGPHAPFDARSRRALARTGGEPTRLMNNCSGKHAGFLLLSRDLGAPLADYLDPKGEAQRHVRAAVEAMCAGDGDAALPVGIDGCGAPTFYLPLIGLARGFARLANPEGLSTVRRRACLRLFAAVRAHPEVLSGETRFCAALMRATPTGLYPKNGAEGVYAVGVPASPQRPGFGLAIKIADGAERGYWPVVVEALRRLGVWGRGASVPEPLGRFCPVPVINTLREQVGVVEAVGEALEGLDRGAR